MNIFQKLSYIAEVEFSDIVETVEESEDKLRIYLIDGSDNIPHKKWEFVKTFPKHFHCGSEKEVIESSINDNPEDAIRDILTFGRQILN